MKTIQLDVARRLENLTDFLGGYHVGEYTLAQLFPMELTQTEKAVIGRALQKHDGAALKGGKRFVVFGDGRKRRYHIVSKKLPGTFGRIASILERTDTEKAAKPFEVPIAQARKMFYDYLDAQRPWARCKDGGVYEMMEDIVDCAAHAFRRDIRPKKEDVDRMQRDLMRFTAELDTHPENYDGPCACAECRMEAE